MYFCAWHRPSWVASPFVDGLALCWWPRPLRVAIPASGDWRSELCAGQINEFTRSVGVGVVPCPLATEGAPPRAALCGGVTVRSPPLPSLAHAGVATFRPSHGRCASNTTHRHHGAGTGVTRWGGQVRGRRDLWGGGGGAQRRGALWWSGCHFRPTAPRRSGRGGAGRGRKKHCGWAEAVTKFQCAGQNNCVWAGGGTGSHKRAAPGGWGVQD